MIIGASGGFYHVNRDQYFPRPIQRELFTNNICTGLTSTVMVIQCDYRMGQKQQINLKFNQCDTHATRIGVSETARFQYPIG